MRAEISDGVKRTPCSFHNFWGNKVMAVPVRVFEDPKAVGELGELRAMPVQKLCRFAACQEPEITAIGDENLCCDHFVVRCYEFLEQIDQERAKSGCNPTRTAELKRSVNSCLQGALEVSLKSRTLSNLQKARLLDIMLWAGEFVRQTDLHFALGSGISAEKVGIVAPGRAPYEKPRVKSRTTIPQ
ncbi:MAG: hypothetical protein JSS69_08510 [Acidobacteria bacterium]|nr:hypothetical protein [Acidobacteriota bacterium]MBS1865946.1 hypothetical protein [Acidobacteriota bacterium]